MIRQLKNVFIHARLFSLLGGLAVICALGFPFPILFTVTPFIAAALLGIIVWDLKLLFSKSIHIELERNLPKLMSLGNVNTIRTVIINKSNVDLNVAVFQQLPFQFQNRESDVKVELNKNQTKTILNELRPVVRGEYEFGNTLLYIKSKFSIFERKIEINNHSMVPVYPSIMDVKKFELQAMRNTSQSFGMKQIRRLGQSHEFEQISDYSLGDDFQSINWKATSRSNRLMVNKFTDEKAQPVYCFIDKSRYMKMPFKGLSLLDYAINTSLIIANTALKRDDKAGLMTFSDKMETFIKADRRKTQFGKILHSLYKEKETKIEANYELMYAKTRSLVNGRSLIFFYTNFDSIHALERVLPVLRKINKMHLLVVVIFQNTELYDYHQKEANDITDIYNQTIAHKFITEKSQVIMTLHRYGIQVIYSKPEELSINSINKYLELKSRGMI